MLDLSIVLPTCNRAAMLRKAIDVIASNTRCDYELIVVDGAGGDATSNVLRDAADRLGDRLRVIREARREGFVKAANKGFRAAIGRNLCWLNDDARPVGDSLDLAVEQTDRAGDDVGFVAMFHDWHSPRNVAFETTRGGKTFRLCHVRGTLYANFPVGRRTTFERLGYFDERYFVCAADPDLSLKAWHAGLSVVPAYGTAIDHDEVDDPRRRDDHPRASVDNERLFAKWDLPPKNLTRNEFDPASPRTLRGLHSPEAAIEFMRETAIAA